LVRGGRHSWRRRRILPTTLSSRSRLRYLCRVLYQAAPWPQGATTALLHRFPNELSSGIRTMHSLAAHSITSRLLNSLAFVMERFEKLNPHALRVLTYHRILESNNLAFQTGLASATPSDFEAQMRFLARHYRVVSMPEVLRAFSEGGPLPERSVLITFDDAYQDVAENAWPILERYSLPAAMFVATAYPDQPEQVFWWDRLHQAISSSEPLTKLPGQFHELEFHDPVARARSYKVLNGHCKLLRNDELQTFVCDVSKRLTQTPATNKVMGWDAIRRLASAGMAIGAHTRTHPLLNQVSVARAREEVLGSLEDVKRELGSVLPIFAYPGGSLTAEVVNVADEAGVVLAFTTERGGNEVGITDRLRIRRINVGRNTTLPVLRTRLVACSTSGRLGRVQRNPQSQQSLTRKRISVRIADWGWHRLRHGRWQPKMSSCSAESELQTRRPDGFVHAPESDEG